MTARDGPAGKTVALDFHDFLFTLSVSLGLTPEILNIPFYKGLLSEPWLQQGRLPAGVTEWLQVSTLALGFATLTLSWFGFHASIKDKPLQPTIPGMFRFVLDVLLIVSYGVLLIQFRDASMVFSLLLVIHALFFVWDVLKVREHRERYGSEDSKFPPRRPCFLLVSRFRREAVTLFWLAVIGGLCAIQRCAVGTAPSTGLIALVWLAILAVTLYRVNKYHRMWDALFLGRCEAATTAS